jgi:hypothetical protein
VEGVEEQLELGLGADWRTGRRRMKQNIQQSRSREAGTTPEEEEEKEEVLFLFNTIIIHTQASIDGSNFQFQDVS